jgi:hypothetical protein
VRFAVGVCSMAYWKKEDFKGVKEMKKRAI